MVFNTFNWIALMFLVISFAYTNTEVYRSKISTLEEDLEENSRMLTNIDRKVHALNKMIDVAGYQYKGGIISTNSDGSIVDYYFYELEPVKKNKKKG